MRHAAAALVVLLMIPGSARGDYVEVRRAAAIKAAPETDAIVLANPPVGTHLVLAAQGQTNGYYHVRIPPRLGTTETDGYVYRNRVRGFLGDPPEIEPPGTVAFSSEVVYQGIPKNDFPEFPITVLDKGHYVVGYAEDFMNPAWVFYRIGPVVDLRSFRRPGFRVDDETRSRVRTQDYVRSGFDRGHLAPNFALGSRFGPEAASSTFLMSNVCPQYHSFNDGQWGNLEEWIAGRKPPNATMDSFIKGWADEYGGVWVVVGPLFEEDRDPLDSGIPVPSGFFAVVVDELADGTPRALAFVFPHEDRRADDLTVFLKTVDEVELRAGLDFFHLLPDSIENRMESNAATGLWPLPVAPN